MNKGIMKKASVVVLVIVAIGFLISLIHSVRMSFVDYAPFSGLSGSEWVGFGNYKRFFEYKFLGRIMSNTIIINLLTMLSGAIYTFFASSAISSCENSIKIRLKFTLDSLNCLFHKNFWKILLKLSLPLHQGYDCLRLLLFFQLLFHVL